MFLSDIEKRTPWELVMDCIVYHLSTTSWYCLPREVFFLTPWKPQAFNTNIVPSHIFASRCIIQTSSEQGALPETQVHIKRQAKETVHLMAAITRMDAWKRTSDSSQEGGLRGSDAAQAHVYRSALTECSFRKGQSLPNQWGDYIIVTFHFITEQQDTL